VSSADCEASDFIPTRRSLLSRLRVLDDDTSWRDFFDTYWKLIYSSATKAGLSDTEAQEVVQDTILTISRKIEQFKYDPALGSFKGWLLHTTRWRIVDQLRKRQRRAAVEVSEHQAQAETVLEEIPDSISSRLEVIWETEWEQNLVDAAVQRVKRQVKPKHFQIFELYALKGWPVPKVAETLGVNMAQVHLVKHRIANLIRKEVNRLHEKGI
jgi:RNA polymerase sigma factor (sigma-70 family)